MVIIRIQSQCFICFLQPCKQRINIYKISNNKQKNLIIILSFFSEGNYNYQRYVIIYYSQLKNYNSCQRSISLLIVSTFIIEIK